jgi:transcriptional regulator with XRE-family HTH domain
VGLEEGQMAPSAPELSLEGLDTMAGVRRESLDSIPRLGQRIRELRKSLQLTQEQLAERASISVSFLSMIERGDRVPHLQTLAMLAKPLGVSLAEVFIGIGESSPSGQNALLPLIEYLEQQSLDSGDVEALLVIAKALLRYKGR